MVNVKVGDELIDNESGERWRVYGINPSGAIKVEHPKMNYVTVFFPHELKFCTIVSAQFSR